MNKPEEQVLEWFQFQPRYIDPFIPRTFSISNIKVSNLFM